MRQFRNTQWTWKHHDPLQKQTQPARLVGSKTLPSHGGPCTPLRFRETSGFGQLGLSDVSTQRFFPNATVLLSWTALGQPSTLQEVARKRFHRGRLFCKAIKREEKGFSGPSWKGVKLPYHQTQQKGFPLCSGQEYRQNYNYLLSF